MKQLVQVIFILVLFSNCSSTAFNYSYLSPALENARSSDKSIAILPFDVINHIKIRPEGASAQSLKDAEEFDAYIMQRDLYRYCLRASSKDRYTVYFQHVNETNKILTSKGINYEDIKNWKKGNLAEILGVDAVISGEVHQIKYKRNGSLFGGERRLRKKVDARLAIHNRKNKKPVWKYNNGVSIASENTSLSLSRKLLRSVALVIPYQKKQEARAR